MSTWHQNQAKVPLYHPTKWTLVIDPPGRHKSVQRCESCAEAERIQRILKEHGTEHTYILPPESHNGLGHSSQVNLHD